MPAEKNAFDLLADVWRDLLDKERTLLDLGRKAAADLLREDIDKRRGFQRQRDGLRPRDAGKAGDRARDAAQKWFDAQLEALDGARQTLDAELTQRRKEAQEKRDLAARWESDITDLFADLATVDDVAAAAAKRVADVQSDLDQARADGLSARVAKLQSDLAVATATKDSLRSKDAMTKNLDDAVAGWRAARAELAKLVGVAPGTADDPAHRTIETLEIELAKLDKAGAYLREHAPDIIAARMAPQQPPGPGAGNA